MSIDNAAALSPTIRVAAVQMTAKFGDVDANLAKAERLVRMAFERGADWVILPELFASGNAFHPQMAKTTRAIDGSPAELLRELARQGNATVGRYSFDVERSHLLLHAGLSRRFPRPHFSRLRGVTRRNWGLTRKSECVTVKPQLTYLASARFAPCARQGLEIEGERARPIFPHLRRPRRELG